MQAKKRFIFFILKKRFRVPIQSNTPRRSSAREYHSTPCLSARCTRVRPAYLLSSNLESRAVLCCRTLVFVSIFKQRVLKFLELFCHSISFHLKISRIFTYQSSILPWSETINPIAILYFASLPQMSHIVSILSPDLFTYFSSAPSSIRNSCRLIISTPFSS